MDISSINGQMICKTALNRRRSDLPSENQTIHMICLLQKQRHLLHYSIQLR